MVLTEKISSAREEDDADSEIFGSDGSEFEEEERRVLVARNIGYACCCCGPGAVKEVR